MALALQVLWGDLGESALDVLSALSAEIALPLLKGQFKQGSWSVAAAAEITDALQGFASDGAYPST